MARADIIVGCPQGANGFTQFRCEFRNLWLAARTDCHEARNNGEDVLDTMRKFICQQVAGFGHSALAVDVDDCSEPTRFSRSGRRSNGSREHPAIIAICKLQAPFVFEGFPALQRSPKGVDRSFPVFGVNGSLPVIQTLRLGKTSQFIPLHIDVVEITRGISRPSNPGNAVDHPFEIAFPLVDSFLCRIAQALLGYAPHRSLRQNRQRVLLKL